MGGGGRPSLGSCVGDTGKSGERRESGRLPGSCDGGVGVGVEYGRLGVATLWRWRQRGNLVGGGALDLWLRDLGTRFGD